MAIIRLPAPRTGLHARAGIVMLAALATVAIIGPAAARSPYLRATDDPLGLAKSPVYEVFGVYAVRGTRVHQASLRRMITTGITSLADNADPCAAWRTFVSDKDIIALNFTRAGGRELGVNVGVAEALLTSLYEAGFRAENIMLVGLEELPPNAAGTRPAFYGWRTTPSDFASDADYLAAWLDEATAIINVPSILDDNVIGLRAGMANMAWPLVKRPARLYLNQGDPFIADINALDELRRKLRLTITNGLRILYHGGPVVQQRYVYERGTLIFSADPVAADRVALEIIQRARETMIMPADTPTAISADYLHTAAALGLGYLNLNQIQYRYIRHERW